MESKGTSNKQLPLGFEELAQFIDTDCQQVSVRSIDPTTTNPSVEGLELYLDATKISFDSPSPHFLLVPGGWLPAPFSPVERIFVDRNIISSLNGWRNEKRRKGDQERSIWADFDTPTFKFSSALAAFEGSNKSSPSLMNFTKEVEEFDSQVQLALPSARIDSLSSAESAQVFAALDKTRTLWKEQQAFLLAISPELVGSVKQAEVEALSARIVDTAREHSLEAMSLVVLACLAIATGTKEKKTGRDRAAARRLIKPSTDFDESNAYNALADLALLEVLANLDGLGYPVSVLTNDRGLALFWSGLGLQRRAEQMTLQLSDALFPRIERSVLRELISS